MIRFFRKIRHKLLSQNKFTKYFLYAIGEIVLVVIGIIIALQINNWNDLRKAENEEFKLYHNILNDLNDELSHIEEQMEIVNKYQDLHLHVFNETKGKAEYSPTIYYNFLLWIHRYSMFFNEKYSESLSTITNNKIHGYLKSYIKQENVTKAAVDEWNEYKLKQTRPYLSRHGINNSDAIFEEPSYDFSSLTILDLIKHSKLKDQFGTIELDQLLFTLRFKTSWMLQNLIWLKEFNREFDKILKKELNISEQSENDKITAPRTLSKLFDKGKTIDEIINLIKSENSIKSNDNISENEINRFGYDLMDNKKYNEAREIFRLNTELFPSSFNTFDSYAECLFKMGDKEKSVIAYRKSLELNPNNKNAQKMLKFLEKEL